MSRNGGAACGEVIRGGSGPPDNEPLTEICLRSGLIGDGAGLNLGETEGSLLCCLLSASALGDFDFVDGDDIFITIYNNITR